jgi:sarcosine oxidase
MGRSNEAVTFIEAGGLFVDGIDDYETRCRRSSSRDRLAKGFCVVTDLGLVLQVDRHVQMWFRPPGGSRPFEQPHIPMYVWDSAEGRQAYGFPQIGPASAGVKAALFRNGEPADPDRLRRAVDPAEAAQLREYLSTRLPGLPGELVRAVPCMYTNTPEEHFVLGLHPAHPNVVVAGGFSGHGFKFVPVIGEILADLAIDGGTRYDIELFDPDRGAGLRSAGR